LAIFKRLFEQTFAKVKLSKIENYPLVAVGGVGGSGTRVVAHLLTSCGIHLGTDKNESEDNLWFTLLFKRRELLAKNVNEFNLLSRILARAMTGKGPVSPDFSKIIDVLSSDSRPQHPVQWLKRRSVTLSKALREHESLNVPWGWKEPNTHIFLPQLLNCYPTLRYVHVIRHGCDMALSENQNQLETWGDHFVSNSIKDPRNSLKYWVKANQRILKLSKIHKDSILFVRFEDICSTPESSMGSIMEFVGREISSQQADEFVSGIHPPHSIGRYLEFDLNGFDREDLNALQLFGYSA